jgi:DNA-binding response OmpR family regulator
MNARGFAGTLQRFGRSQTGIKIADSRSRLCEYSSSRTTPLIREFVVEALREEGYQVIHAANGEDALAWCGRQVADVLVTDVRLPGRVDGWQIAERCREQDPELPVIYATGFSPVAPRPVSGSLVLQKPYDPADIVRAVKTLGRRASPN